LIDDWASQSRLDFLQYNSLLRFTGDDGTMESKIVKDNRITLTPKGTSSYFYSQFGCLDARSLGGIALRIKAPAGTTFRVELLSRITCEGSGTTSTSRTTAQLGWTFDGTEKLYSFSLSGFSGIDLTRLRSIVISSPNNPLTLGPMAFYCGTTPTEWTLPTPTGPVAPTVTVS
jgi:hypothetical protein